MHVLIDECVDPRVASLLGDHRAGTVHQQGWDALQDGPLLTVAQEDFDVLLTLDRGLEFQRNLAKFRIGLIVAHVPKNQLPYFRVIQKELLTAIERVRPGEVIHVRTPT